MKVKMVRYPMEKHKMVIAYQMPEADGLMPQLSVEDVMKIGELAAMAREYGIETGQQRLFQWMRDNGYVYRQGCGQNLPTEKSLELGLMDVLVVENTSARGLKNTMWVPVVTPEGQRYFLNVLTHEKEEINSREQAKKETQRQKNKTA